MPLLYYCDSTDPSFNLALEELLAAEATQESFMLWRNSPSIIIGRHQNTSAEIDEDYTRTHGITVVRRITGGGAVYHDLGNINFSFITLERTWGPESAARYTAPIVAALQALGLDAAFSGRNDILANGCKVSGCARSVTREHTLFHGTLLFDTDLTVLADALKPDPDKIRSKGIKSVRARVGNIREMLPPPSRNMSMANFIDHLRAFLPAYFHEPSFTPLPAALSDRAQQLADGKYRTWDWNFGTPLAYDMVKKLQFAGGIIHAHLNIRDNLIADLRFTGDFFGTLPVDDLVNAVNGTVPRRQTLLARLASLNIGDYIAGLTAEALANLLAVSD